MKTRRKVSMRGETTKVRSSSGGGFDCYIAAPESQERVPGIVLASAVYGVDDDIRAIAGEFAEEGFIAAAPDLFWRSTSGPLRRDDERAAQRSQPRLDVIRSGEEDMTDTLNFLHTLTNFNGRAVAMGFCYGGPYAILGPKRLGYAAGISCHGSQMLDFVHELDGVDAPVCITWGDQDHRAPADVLEAYLDMASRKRNVELHIIPGAVHGFMMRSSEKAFDSAAYKTSMARAVAILEDLND
jgi:carboxymethylenebutenolidase